MKFCVGEPLASWAACATVAKHWERLKGEEPWVRRGEVVRYFVGKGFSTEQIDAALGEPQEGSGVRGRS